MIEVTNLTKVFGAKVAVDNISFRVEKGEVLGFLGPNGAGKSTTMRMVTGYLPPTGGTVTIEGNDIVDAELAAKVKIGYLPENAPLYNDMSVEDFLAFCAEVRGMSGVERSKAVDRALDTCFLQPVRHQSIDTLSKGYRHRTCFAQSIIHDPDVLILDEPTDGLDPNQKHEVRGLIRRMGEKKVIIFSTHILEEVEAACTRAIVIDRGKVVADGTPAELKSKSTAAGQVRVRATGLAGTGIRQELEKLSEVKSVTVIDSGDNYFSGVCEATKAGNGEVSKAVFRMCVDRKLVLEELSPEEGRLDDVFREMTRSDTED
ncbi:MAG: ATP-binding cassette domain-containing protein [Verrucomicrobiota bacterium]